VVTKPKGPTRRKKEGHYENQTSRGGAGGTKPDSCGKTKKKLMWEAQGPGKGEQHLLQDGQKRTLTEAPDKRVLKGTEVQQEGGSFLLRKKRVGHSATM